MENSFVLHAPGFDLKKSIQSGQAFRWKEEADGLWLGICRSHPVLLRQEGDCLYGTAELPEAETAGEMEGARGGISWAMAILTSPIWFAVLIIITTAIPVAAACIIALAAVLAALAVALPVCAVAMLAACGALLYMHHIACIPALGCAMVLAGISILVWKLVWPLVRGMGRGCVKACRACARGMNRVWGRICGRKG